MFQKWVYPRVTWYCYANDLIPFIIMPIRPKTRTLIDNIFSNNYKENQKQDRGIIYADLSDHFPIYNISKNINKAVILSDIEKKEDPCWLLLIFLAVMTDLKNPNETDAQTAYDCFHIKLTECY